MVYKEGMDWWLLAVTSDLAAKGLAYDLEVAIAGPRKGWFSNTSFTTGLKTLLTFRPDALVFFRAKINLYNKCSSSP